MTDGPLQSSGRIQAIDVLRGIALLGIVVVNASIFGRPLAELVGGGFDAELLTDRLTRLFVVVVAEFKFVSLFSLLFGFGLAMQRQRRLAAGRSFAWFGVRRMVILGIFGMIHAIAIWYGDILFIYAGIGLLLLPLLQLGATTRLVLGVIAIAWSTLAIAALNGLTLAMQVPPDPSTVDTSLRGWDAVFSASFDPAHPNWVAAETAALASGPFLDATLFRSLAWSFSLFFTAFSFGWHMLGMALIGTWMHEVGLFGSDAVDRQRRLAVSTFPLGCLLSIACGTIFWWASGTAIGVVAQSVQMISAALMAVGGAMLITRLVEAGRVPGARILASIGRMSLTAYLLESVIFTAITVHWGLGWFGQLSVAQLVGLAFVVYALVAVFCVVWIARFRMGPMEWLWRTASYLGRPNPGST